MSVLFLMSVANLKKWMALLKISNNLIGTNTRNPSLFWMNLHERKNSKLKAEVAWHQLNCQASCRLANHDSGIHFGRTYREFSQRNYIHVFSASTVCATGPIKISSLHLALELPSSAFLAEKRWIGFSRKLKVTGCNHFRITCWSVFKLIGKQKQMS